MPVETSYTHTHKPYKATNVKMKTKPRTRTHLNFPLYGLVTKPERTPVDLSNPP